MAGADPRVDPADEAEVPALLARGADLFNAAHYWHAHEAWEDAWHALRAAVRREDAEFVQGLILATAAFENLRRGKPAGFRTQIAKAVDRLERNAGAGWRVGLANEDAFVEGLRLLAAWSAGIGPTARIDELPAPVPRLACDEAAGPDG